MQRSVRSAQIETGKVNADEMTVEVSFSSEHPVKRQFGHEVLGHSEGEVDLSRLNDGAAVLVNHGGDQIGVVERATIVAKRGLATLRFSRNNEYAKSVFQDIVDGIRKNISVGYGIGEFVRSGTHEDGAGIYRATRWSPGEISVVPVPADPSIGIGRSQETVEVSVPEDFPTDENKDETRADELTIVDGKVMRDEVELCTEDEVRSLFNTPKTTEENQENTEDSRTEDENLTESSKNNLSLRKKQLTLLKLHM